MVPVRRIMTRSFGYDRAQHHDEQQHRAMASLDKKWGGLGFTRSKAETVQSWCREHYSHKTPVRAS